MKPEPLKEGTSPLKEKRRIYPHPEHGKDDCFTRKDVASAVEGFVEDFKEVIEGIAKQNNDSVRGNVILHLIDKKKSKWFDLEKNPIRTCVHGCGEFDDLMKHYSEEHKNE